VLRPNPRSSPLLCLALLAGACSRQEFALGDDWRDAGGSAPGQNMDAGSPPDAGHAGACGSRGLPACADGEYCNFPPSAACGTADAPGVCTARPSTCSSADAPVCGCDGMNYSNPCWAQAAGTSIAHSGRCDVEPSLAKECGGSSGKTCESDQYCDFGDDPDCGATKPGSCKPLGGGACTLQFDPVCGCDSRTYDNACTAAAAGVSIARSGACAADGGMPQPCGTRGAQPCPAGFFCDYARDAACGAADAPGMCAEQPSACTDDFMPVCGCDDKTYSNRCEAASAGVAVSAEGECASKPVCGGMRGQSCVSGEYCDYADGALCGIADATGVCETIPTACTLELEQVCGCDGKTYDNRCIAAMAGTGVLMDGPCNDQTSSGMSCGGLVPATCPSEQYCNFPRDATCGAADQTGTCADIPQVCTTEYNPVCGCDDNTYANPCQAALAGVSVRADGAC
jgi:hypothetical protein